MAFVVKSIKNGKFYMQTPDGEIVELKPGMKILPDSIVFGADTNSINAEVVIEGGNAPIIIRGYETQVFDISMFANNEVEKHNIHKNVQTTTHTTTHVTHKAVEHAKNVTHNPEKIVTQAGNNVQAKDLLSSDFESIEVNFNNVDVNVDVSIPIVSTIISNNETMVVPVEIIKEFLGNAQNDTGVVYEAGLAYGSESSEVPTTFKGNIFSNDSLYTNVKILDVNGITPNENGIIDITTKEGNHFLLNANTGDYTYELLKPLKHIVDGKPVDVLTQNFNVRLEDSYGHETIESVSIKVIDDTPKIIGNDINISMSAQNLPHILADIDINAQMVKKIGLILDNLTPDKFNQLKTFFIDNLDAITNTLKNLTDINTDNVDLNSYEQKLISYLQNLDMNENGDIIYHSSNGDLLISNIYTHYVNNDAINLIHDKLDTFIQNHPSLPQSYLLKQFVDTILTPQGIDNLKTAIAEDKFDIHLIVDGMRLEDGKFHVDNINLDALVGNEHIIKTINVSEPLVTDIEIKGKLFDFFGHDGVVYGADLGHIDSIEVDNKIYNFEPNNPIQTIQTQNGDITINFLNADVTFKYNGDIIQPLDITQNMKITLVDTDGDISSKEVTLHFGLDEAVPVLPSQIHDIDLGAGNDSILPMDLAHMPDMIKEVANLLGINEINKNIDFNNIENLKNIEIFNLDKIDNASINNLSLDDVLEITDNRNHLLIVGDNDIVNEVDTQGWSKVGQKHITFSDGEGNSTEATTYIYTNGHDYVALSVSEQIDHTAL